ncbi:hypothetical protein G5V57_24305 [Nordella sp. HKS 07]|uniref:hypothetical protein n=1 Tax=Nordella sp. HKS 07 TaxID=2712222 RepID=UPI0013E17243|nr:hypothetical protein [Nordella sp. HKS 07]QIG50576.1 hypothetical protein G5V57_24305 [Nordella sp. HKS 07]
MPDIFQMLRKEISLDYSFHAVTSRPSKWAILLLKFNNEPKPSTPTLDFYERLFTGKGAGTLNVPEFFSDVSHGQLDLSASKVFDWMTINANRSDYAGNIADKDVPKGKFNRNGLMTLGYQTALDNKVPVGDYEGIVYSFSGRMDLFGVTGGMAAVCDTASLWPSLLGQEMGHGYGLDHSRADGSSQEYKDIWDIMSTNVGGTFSTPNPNYSFVGPGMNAWNMRSRGWLNENRVWKPLFEHFGTQDVVLRPLHRRDLRGYLAAELGPYLVEFRVAELWDAGLQGGGGILVHRFADNVSYVMGSPASVALFSPFGAHPQKVGEPFQVGDDAHQFSPLYRCEVIAIDNSARTATVRLSYRAAAKPPGPHQRPFELGPLVDEGINFYVQNGHVVRIPPHGPLMQIMQQVIAHTEASTIPDTGIRSLTQATALTSLMRHAADALRALDPIRSPAPKPHNPQINAKKPSQLKATTKLKVAKIRKLKNSSGERS